MSEAEREAMQQRVELLHRNWTKDREYLAPPAEGQLAELDPAMIVTHRLDSRLATYPSSLDRNLRHQETSALASVPTSLAGSKTHARDATATEFRSSLRGDAGVRGTIAIDRWFKPTNTWPVLAVLEPFRSSFAVPTARTLDTAFAPN